MKRISVGRREFIALVAGAAAWPLAARAQQPTRMWRIGFLGLTSAASHAPRVEALREGLRALGYVEGKNIAIEFRWAAGHYDHLPGLAADLVRLNVDVIATHSTAGALAAKRATATVPIVITAVADMLALGLVASLARPGGNITGLSFFNPELAAKRIELLKEFVPTLTRAALLINPDNPSSMRLIHEAMRTTADALNLELRTFEARGPSDFERAFEAMANQNIEAAVIHEDPVLNSHSQTIAELAAKYRLPSCGFPEFAMAGGLMAYGIHFPDMDRRAAAFIDKILKGAKPGDLPVERSTRFRLIANLTAAKALGREFPTSILLRADEVIE